MALNRILLILESEKEKGNHLIGSCSFTSVDPETVIEPPKVSAYQIFPQVKKLIENTDHELLIVFYKFQSDSDGAMAVLEGLENLKRKAEQNQQKIAIRILINKKTGPATFISGDGRTSAITEKMSLISPSEYFDIQVGDYEHEFFDSTHSKILISDAAHLAVLTGDPTFKNTMDSTKSWVEVGSICHNNSIALGAKNSFANLWNNDKLQLLDKTQIKSNVAVSVNTLSSDEYQKVVYLGKNPSKSPFVSWKSPYKIALLELLNSATHSVQIMVNNINDPEILEAILKCADRQVKVELVVGRYHGESAEKLPFAGGTNLESIEKLVNQAASSQSRYLDLRWATNEDQFLVQNMDEGTIHAKVVIVDKKYVLTGSSLMDQQSLRSGESDILFESINLAAQYQRYAFSPVFDRARSILFIPPSRERIAQLLEKAESISDIKKIVIEYSLMREYEDEYHGIQFFSKYIDRYSDYSRVNKTSDTKFFLSYLEGKIGEDKFITEVDSRKCLHDGLLGEIFNKYLLIKDKSIINNSIFNMKNNYQPYTKKSTDKNNVIIDNKQNKSLR